MTIDEVTVNIGWFIALWLAYRVLQGKYKPSKRMQTAMLTYVATESAIGASIKLDLRERRFRF